MPPYKKQRCDRNYRHEVVAPCVSWQYRIAAFAMMFGGPLLLLYLIIRCEKNQCVLFQLPVVLPNHLSAYFSITSVSLVLGFILLMFLTSSSKPSYYEEIKGVPPSFSALLTLSLILVALTLAKPEVIGTLHNEYLRLFSVTLVFCIMLNTTLFVLAQAKIISKERDYCLPMAFFFGNLTQFVFGRVELKYFLYAHVGMVAWGLLDLLILLNAVLESTVTAPLIFIAVSQYIIVAHTVLFENFLRSRPFTETEGLGFFWMLRVLLYLPFLHSLPAYYAAVTEVTLNKPALMANCVFFLFGFVIYVTSIHQKESFVSDPASNKQYRSMPYFPGKRVMVGGYWAIVQKPDYLGYMIMWMSWALACGLSGLAVLVLLLIYASVLLMLHQSTNIKKIKYGTTWNRYTALVPYKLIPNVF
ncbi:delta(14)-sterol reductase [Elysia marginata]|uniref:Delta(14)-sterol reductase n=1 Tax=Elysia marginata TaxID=1093978 RepID=A0AAV4J0F7_9GAST|nr:delta(14)-sterol reductase [Elysia marginata]